MKDDVEIIQKGQQGGEMIGGGKLAALQQKVAHETLLHEEHWMMKIFPSKTDFEKSKYQAEIFKLKSESEYALIKMHREAMKQSFKEALDTMLMNGKVKTRKDRAEFFAYHAKELEKSIQVAVDDFMEVTNARIEKMLKLKHEALVEWENKAIKSSMDHFYQSIEKMKANFHQIVEEGV